MPKNLLSSSDPLLTYSTIRPIASEKFRSELRDQLLAAATENTELLHNPARFSIIKSRVGKFVFVGAMVIFLGILASLTISRPVWSKIQKQLQRFFSITALDTSTQPTTTQFWSDISPAELQKIHQPYLFSYTNSLTPEESITQPEIPAGYNSVSEYILATYPVKNYRSITEIIKNLPVEIIRTEPYYNGRLYILRFPQGFIVAYAEFIGSIGSSRSLIQSFR